VDKQEFIQQTVSDLMYDDEYLEYAEAMDIAERLWQDLKED
jgi:hypothetical protein